MISFDRTPNNRYLVVKYAPDVRRMEPRNIGVFVWVKGAVAARFLPDNEAKFIEDKKNYLRWRQFWFDQLSGDEIHPLRGEPISKSHPDFMDALLKTQEGNYLLSRGGSLLDDLDQVEADDAAEFLFDQLVAVHHQKEPSEHESLTALSDKLMSESGLSTLPEFRQRYALSVPLFGVPQDIVLDYAIADQDPDWVFQKVSLRGNQVGARSTALMFDALRSSKRIRHKSHCVSLVDSTEPNAATSTLNLLSKVGRVVDMADFSQALKEVSASSGHR